MPETVAVDVDAVIDKQVRDVASLFSKAAKKIASRGEGVLIIGLLQSATTVSSTFLPRLQERPPL
jgi:hypothetical protein